MIFQTRLLHAALVCAAKNDVRYYLNGLHITPKYIEATNGHVALRMAHGIRTKKNIIVRFVGNVPARAETTELIFGKELIAVHRDAHQRRIAVSGIELVNGRFPDLDRVIPSKVDGSVNPVVQAEFLSYPRKMFSRERSFIPLQLLPSWPEQAIRIKFDNHICSTYGNPQFVVMPCRDNAFNTVKESLA
jgi:DNA polymerase-3 subunit beta